MFWAISGELILAVASFFVGVNFWSVVGSYVHFQNIMQNAVELERILSYIGPNNIISEAQKIEPVFGSYLKNIHVSEQAHISALSKARFILAVFALILLIISFFMGIYYLLANLFLLVLPISFGPTASSKNNNVSLVHTAFLNVYKWNKEDRAGCFKSCTIDNPGLQFIYYLIDKLP